MKTKPLATVLAFLSVAVFFSSTVSANLVTNGSFENPDVVDGSATGAPSTGPNGFNAFGIGNTGVTGWTISGNQLFILDGFDNFNNWNNPSVASDGDQFAQLGWHTAGSPTVSQTIATTAGQQYTLTFDYGGAGAGTQNVTLGYLVDGVNNSVNYNLDNLFVMQNTWASETYTFTASSNSTTLSFVGESSQGGFWGTGIDNVVVLAVAVPEPSTITLFCGSLFALLSRRRR